MYYLVNQAKNPCYSAKSAVTFNFLFFTFRYVLQQAAVVDDIEGEVRQRIEADLRSGSFVLDRSVFVVDLQLVVGVDFFERVR